MPVRTTQWGQLLRLFGAHAFAWIGVQTMFVYIIAFIQQKMPLPRDAALAAEETGRIIAIAFAVLNTVGFLLPAPVLEPLARRIRPCARAHHRHGHHGGGILRDRCRRSYTAHAVPPHGGGRDRLGLRRLASVRDHVGESGDRDAWGCSWGCSISRSCLPQLFVSLVLGSVIQAAEDKTIIFLISGTALAASTFVWTFVRDERPSGPAVPTGGH